MKTLTELDCQYRPKWHYSAERNWLNDPNGLVYANGIYHLFYQHNPHGDVWGNMSWGHATSTDLQHWDEQPVAIACDEQEAIFSGSAVVDVHNTSGFGVGGVPPLVAIYTSAYSPASPLAGRQAQSLAYSTDDGATWTKYAGNPVLDRGLRGLPRPQGLLARRRRRQLLGDGRRRGGPPRGGPLQVGGPEDLGVPEHLRPGERHGRRVGMPGPVRTAGGRRRLQHPVGPGGQPEPRRHRRRLGRPVLHRNLRRRDVPFRNHRHRRRAGRRQPDGRLRVARLGPGLLRGRVLQQRPGRTAAHDRLDEQLAVRRLNALGRLAQRDVPGPRGQAGVPRRAPGAGAGGGGPVPQPRYRGVRAGPAAVGGRGDLASGRGLW